MTDDAARAEILRNRTEKDEKEFQNYYATLRTGADRELAQMIWKRGAPLEEVKWYVDFYLHPPETQAALERSGATPIELKS